MSRDFDFGDGQWPFNDDGNLPNGWGDEYIEEDIKGNEQLIEYMMINLSWSHVIKKIYHDYESRGEYLISKEEKALTTMMNRGLGDMPKGVKKQ